MRPKQEETANLVTFTEEIPNEKLPFLCSSKYKIPLHHTVLHLSHIASDCCIDSFAHILSGEFAKHQKVYMKLENIFHLRSMCKFPVDYCTLLENLDCSRRSTLNLCHLKIYITI